MNVNKTHVASTGVSSGFLALGINLFFPRLHLSPDQMAYIVGLLPAMAMGFVAAIETAWPHSAPVISAAEKAV